MVTKIQQVDTINFQTKSGELITATKKGNKVFINGEKIGSKELPYDEFKTFYHNNVSRLERTPRQDEYISSGKAKHDKELMRTLFYSNPFVNPFGYIPTKDGLEPVVPNPMLESLLNMLYGKAV